MRPNIIKPTNRKGARLTINRKLLINRTKLRGGAIMENVIAIPMDRVIIVGKDFDKYFEAHKEESRKAREINHRRAMAIRKNRIED